MKARIMMTASAMAMAIAAGCSKDDDAGRYTEVGPRPDVLPVMLNKELPFRYPPSLYSRKVQANVTLRVFIDQEGQIVSESTHVAETSGHPSMDSAAVRGSSDLRFIPAKTRGQSVPVSILFPVYFRHPEAPPLPGDTIIGRKAETQAPGTGQ